MTAPKIKLNNGCEIPAFGLGTYSSTGGDCERSVKDAIDAGYRHIDSAYVYGNETEVGKAVNEKISEGIITRADIFITTKLWCNFHESERVEPACRKSLGNLGLEYIDLYLMHFPLAMEYVGEEATSFRSDKTKYIDIDYIDTWKAMEKLVTLGLVRSIGVSNFNSQQIERIVANATIKPVVNQVECSPAINQKNLTKYCKDRNIVITAYTPLGRPKPQEQTPDFIYNAKVKIIADKYQKTTPQVVLRYLYQLGVIPIPKSVTKERIIANIQIFDFELTDEEVAVLDTFNTGKRVVAAEQAVSAPYYPFSIEF